MSLFYPSCWEKDGVLYKDKPDASQGYRPLYCKDDVYKVFEEGRAQGVIDCNQSIEADFEERCRNLRISEDAESLAQYLEFFIDDASDYSEDNIQSAALLLRKLKKERDMLFAAHAHEMARADTLAAKDALAVTLVKKEDGELIAVTMTDEEHRIHEVLWKKTK